MNQDRSFANRVSRFKNNIYGTSKGKIRQAILLRDLAPVVKQGKCLRILDVGGGQGQIALQFAQLGHDVTINDISKEMLDVAICEAEQQNLSITTVCCPLQELNIDQLGQFDLVMCHAVFEWLEDAESALALLRSLCKDDGVISLMYYNQVGQVMSNLIYGNFDYVKSDFNVKKPVKLNPQRAYSFEQVEQWLTKEHLSIACESGVRVIHDYVRDKSTQSDQFDALLEMELKFSQVQPFQKLGRYTHLLLTRKQ